MWPLIILALGVVFITGGVLWFGRMEKRLRAELASAHVLFSAEAQASISGGVAFARTASWMKCEVVVTDRAVVLYPRGYVPTTQPIVLVRDADETLGGAIGLIRVVVDGPPEHARTRLTKAPAVAMRGSQGMAKWTVTLRTSDLDDLFAALQGFVTGTLPDGTYRDRPGSPPE